MCNKTQIITGGGRESQENKWEETRSLIHAFTYFHCNKKNNFVRGEFNNVNKYVVKDM
jgi:hypothetical protein